MCVESIALRRNIYKSMTVSGLLSIFQPNPRALVLLSLILSAMMERSISLPAKYAAEVAVFDSGIDSDKDGVMLAIDTLERSLSAFKEEDSFSDGPSSVHLAIGDPSGRVSY